jgi:hypothetical protein
VRSKFRREFCTPVVFYYVKTCRSTRVERKKRRSGKRSERSEMKSEKN